MSKKFNAMLLGAAISALAAASAVSADAAYKGPLNAYGQPDLEGTWTNATLTQLERPKEYGSRKGMTPEEVKKVEGDDAKMYAADAAPRDPKVKTTDLPHECGKGFSGAGCGYNAAWIDPGHHHAGERRTANLFHHGSCGRTAAALQAGCHRSQHVHASALWREP